MDIQQAKLEIKRSVQAYLKKDAFGSYRVPTVRQRPIFMIGAPGIGKTAIMAQIAKELDIALVSYAMTHHTRQSALGLPFIAEKNYGTTSAKVSEYTMSEIIASVYEAMEASGKQEGILFLDEINCVSETLAPAMLQFLQFKEFGRHAVPDGWVVVCAGNPPEYNRNVREMDIVTMDRLRILEVEEDYGVWRRYALTKGLHSAIVGYLDLKKDDFYKVEALVDGKAYVTARGWEDLSEAMYLYEEEGFPVTEQLIYQYLRHKKVSRVFANFYDLFKLYQSTYDIPAILAGKGSETARSRAKEAAFDEKLSFLGLLSRALLEEVRSYLTEERMLDALYGILSTLPEEPLQGIAVLQKESNALEETLRQQKEAGQLDATTRRDAQYLLQTMAHCVSLLQEDGNARVKSYFNAKEDALEAQAHTLSEAISNVLSFVEAVYGDGEEMLILMTELTVDANASYFLANHPVEAYNRRYERLELDRRTTALQEKVRETKI